MCTHLNVLLKHITAVGRAPLKNGHHKAFEFCQCLECGKFIGFPQNNLLLAVSEGIEETVRVY